MTGIIAARLGASRFPHEESTSLPGRWQPWRMQPLTSSLTIDAPADQVWDIIAHQFGRIGEWAH
jgi:hypothetical protein